MTYKLGKLPRRRQHTAENQSQREEQVSDISGCFGRVDCGDDHGGEGRGEEEEFLDEEEHETATFVELAGGNGVFVEACGWCVSICGPGWRDWFRDGGERTDGVVPAEKDNQTGESIPGQLDNEVRDHEGFPAVGLARSFTGLVKCALCDKVRQDLLNKLAKDGEQGEDGEELILQ